LRGERDRVAGHFIIAGSDAIAVQVAEELTRLGEDVVIMTRQDIEPRFRPRLEREGVRVLEGDARDVVDLQAAGLDRAMGLALVDTRDVINLHAALAAYAARPDLRLVVRMFNEEFGGKLGALFPQARILSASAIAAPAFLDAALRTTQRLKIGDQAVQVRKLSSEDDLTKPVVTLFDPESRSSGLFPPAARGVLALVPAAAREEVRDEIQATSGLGQAASFAASMLTRTVALARLLDRRLIAFLGLLTGIIASAALVWTTTTRLNLLDSAYFAVTTVSTTGYGDITPLHEAATLKLASMGLMLLGALSIAVIYALITDAIVGVRLARSLQERPHPRRDHVVVLGLGRIGQRVIEELVALGIPCIAVERNESAHGVQAARRLGSGGRPRAPCRARACRAHGRSFRRGAQPSSYRFRAARRTRGGSIAATPSGPQRGAPPGSARS